MPTLTRPLRFAAITAVVLMCYLLLHALELPGLALEAGHTVRALLQEPPARTTVPDRADAPAGDPSAVALRRSVAFRLGADLGFVSVLQHATAIKPSAELEAAGHQIMLRVREDAVWLGVGPPAVMQGRTANDQLRLTARAESDETGMAARFSSMSDPRLRHLYMMGVQAGMAHFWIWALGHTSLDAYAPHIETHARAAQLPDALWRPLTRPPEGKRAEAQREYHARLARVIDTLAQP